MDHIDIDINVNIIIIKGYKDCQDNNINNIHCDSWARSGECNNNPAYMLENCKRSCKICGKILRFYIYDKEKNF